MSKYRCPVCGATHKEQPEKCRLCGQYLGSRLTGPALQPEVRQAAGTRRGVADVAVLMIGGVLVIALIFVVLGLTGSNSFLENIRDKIPGLARTEDDGWEEVDDADGGFRVDLPDTAERANATYTLAENSRLEQWVANIGAEVELSVGYATLDADFELDPKSDASVNGLANVYQSTVNANFRQDPQRTSFRGYPATTGTIDGLMMADSNGVNWPATIKVLIVYKEHRAYVLASKSIYQDHPNFGRMVNSFEFTD